MKAVSNLFIAIIFMLCYSCSSVNYLTINIKKPAQITLPANIENITIVDNSPIQPGNIGHEDLIGNQKRSVQITTDSLKTIFTEALTQFMNEDAFYNEVVLYDKPIRSDKVWQEEYMIDHQKIKTIASSTNADAIISLDKLLLQSTLSTEDIENGLTGKTLAVQIQAKLKVYDSLGNQITPHISYNDSLFWEEVSQDNYLLTHKLPVREEALKEMTVIAASKLVGMFDPYWVEQNRWFYVDGTTKMKEAALKVQNNSWQNALEIWEEIYDLEKGKRKKAKLASNIALAYEMLDDIEEALVWINQACNDFLLINKGETSDQDVIRTVAYQKELITRSKDFVNLDIQENHNIKNE